MKKILWFLFAIAIILNLGISPLYAQSNTTFNQGSSTVSTSASGGASTRTSQPCLAGDLFNRYTGERCGTLSQGCQPGDIFNRYNGTRCSTNPQLPAGCTTNQGFSTTTGEPCNVEDGPTILSILPDGCNDPSTVYNALTGEACTNARFNSTITVNGSNFTPTSILQTYSSSTGNLIEMHISKFFSALSMQFIVPSSAGTGPHGLRVYSPEKESLSNTVSLNFEDPGTGGPFPPGCTSFSGYSMTTGEPCGGSTQPLLNLSLDSSIPRDGITYAPNTGGATALRTRFTASGGDATFSQVSVCIQIKNASDLVYVSLNDPTTGYEGRISSLPNWDFARNCYWGSINLPNGFTVPNGTTKILDVDLGISPTAYTPQTIKAGIIGVAGNNNFPAVSGLDVWGKNINIASAGGTQLAPLKITSVGGASSAVVGQPYTLNLSATAPNDDDLIWGVNWIGGTGSAACSGVPSNSHTRLSWNINLSYTYTSAGQYTVLVKVLDCATGGIDTQSLVVNVSNPPINTPTSPSITSFVANPSTIMSGQATSLSWNSTGGTSCYLAGGSTNYSVALNGNTSDSPTQNTTYVLTCYGASGTAPAVKSISVAVQPQVPTPPPAPTPPPTPLPQCTASIYWDKYYAAPGASATETWSVQGADQVWGDCGSGSKQISTGPQSYTFTNLTQSKTCRVWGIIGTNQNACSASATVNVSSTTTGGQGAVLGAETNLLSFNSQGADVVRLQKALNATGYNIGKVDGYYGAIVQAEVIQFEKDHKLKADGIAGPEVQSLLYK